MTETMTKKPYNGEVTQPESTRGGRVFVPPVDIFENEDEMLILADVPGAKADDVDITYEQGVLTFHARVHPRQDDRKTNYILREYAVGDYERAFRLGEMIDSSKIQAEMKDGVLTLHLPKAEPARRRQIKVNQL